MPKTKKFKLPLGITILKKIPYKVTLSMALVIIFMISIGVYNSLPVENAQAAAPTYTIKVQSMNENNFLITFSEPVYTNSNGTGLITISDLIASGTGGYSLSMIRQIEGTNEVIVFTTPSFNLTGSGQLLITCAASEIYNANGEACSQAPFDVFDNAIIDTTLPTISSWDLNMSTGTIDINFSETMKFFYTIHPTYYVLQDALTATTSYTLTFPAGVNTGWLSPSTYRIVLNNTDLVAIIANTSLATNASNTYLRITNTASVQDAVNNQMVVIADGSAIPVNTYTIDTTAPTYSIVQPANGSSTTLATPVMVSADEHVNCTYDLDSSAYTGTLDYTDKKYNTDNIYNMTSGAGIAPGSHTLQVTCTDLSGNPGTTVSSTWTKLAPGNVVLLGSNGQGNTIGDLYTINPQTGSIASTIGSTGTCLTGLAVDPTSGILYGVSSTACTTPSPNSLFTVDVTTGAATLIAQMSGSITSNGCGTILSWGSVGDITFDDAGNMYGADCDGDLHQIDKTTAVTTFYISNGHGYSWGNGIAFDSSIGTTGALYWLGDGDCNDSWEPADLSRVVLGATPSYSDIANIVNGLCNGLGAADLDSSGFIYAVRMEGSTTSPRDLIVIDTTTGIAATMGLLANPDMDKMAAITFYEDTSLPIVTITPGTKTGGGPYTGTTVSVSDAGGVTAANVLATGGTLSCTQTSGTVVDCTVIVNSISLNVIATDNAGNIGTGTEGGYAFPGGTSAGADKVLPTEPTTPTEPTEPTEPTVPTEPTEPVEPTPSAPGETPELILTDPAPAGELPLEVEVGDLVKLADKAAVYFIDNDNRRHTFPNATVFYSWFTDFSAVEIVSANTLAGIEIGPNVTIRPGTWLIKLSTDPKVYAVESYGVLRWLESQEIAKELYGSDWNNRIKDVPSAYFNNYQVGTSVTALVHPSGSVIQYQGETTVYYVEDGVMRMISDSVFTANYFQTKFIITGVGIEITYPAISDLSVMPLETLIQIR